MDFQNAALLILAVYGMTEFAKATLPDSWKSIPRVTVLLALVIGQAAVWLVGTTAWAHEQVIGAKPLDELNTGSKVLVGLFAAGAAAFGDKFLKSVSNIGTPMPTPMSEALRLAKAPDVHAHQTFTPVTDPLPDPLPPAE